MVVRDEVRLVANSIALQQVARSLEGPLGQFRTFRMTCQLDENRNGDAPPVDSNSCPISPR